MRSSLRRLSLGALVALVVSVAADSAQLIQAPVALADVGVDDEVGNNGNVVFQVWLDGVKAWDSGTMTGTTATKSVGGAAGLNVTGKNELRLVVTVGAGGDTSDHGDWADAKVTCS